MFINDSMTQKVITVSPDTELSKAKKKMEENNIRHLPVIDRQNRLVGIITDRDIRTATDPLKKDDPYVKVRNFMTEDVITISPSYTIQDALILIQEKKIGALPVVDDKQTLKGIISVRDLLRTFINVLGINEPGTLIGIIVEEKVGQLKKIVDAITEENISFGSVLVSKYFDKNKRAVFPYLLTSNVGRIKNKLKSLGFELIDPMQWYFDKLPQNR